jgi:hypothetical protein
MPAIAFQPASSVLRLGWASSRNNARAPWYLAAQRLLSHPLITASPDESKIRHSHLDRPRFLITTSSIKHRSAVGQFGSTSQIVRATLDSNEATKFCPLRRMWRRAKLRLEGQPNDESIPGRPLFRNALHVEGNNDLRWVGLTKALQVFQATSQLGSCLHGAAAVGAAAAGAAAYGAYGAYNNCYDAYGNWICSNQYQY